MKGLKGIGVNQRCVLSWMRQGYWLQVTYDNYTCETDRSLTNGDDDIMWVNETLLQSFIDRDLVNVKSWSPSLQIDITQFHLKTEYL